MTEDALEFLRTGAVGEIRVGTPVDEVVRAYGESSDHAHVDARTRILRYDGRQLTVTDGRVVAIGVTDADHGTGPYDVAKLLDEAGIDWAVEPKLTFGKQLCLRAETGVLVLFDLERRMLQRLMTG